jgi:DNA-binding winged helix-turn-helix (wHTH) protein
VSERISFGEFELDFRSRELRRGSALVRLSPKAFELLSILVRSSPTALSKSELQDRLWPDTFVVERNLANLIADVRKALGDDAASPRYVRTVQRFGYAFRAVRSPSGGDPGLSSGHRPAPFRLVWKEGRLALGEGRHILGRDPDLELFFDAPSVSRQHAVITVAGDEATIEDLRSRNGTFVRATRIETPTRLGDGDMIRIGSVTLTIRAVRSQGSTETASTDKR